MRRSKMQTRLLRKLCSNSKKSVDIRFVDSRNLLSTSFMGFESHAHQQPACSKQGDS
jgi:hypothetical protein